MGKLPTWTAMINEIAATLTANVALWQQFYDDAASGTLTFAEAVQTFEGVTMNWMNVWAVALGAGGSPTPPSIFLQGDNWLAGNPTRSGTARLESPIDPTTPLEKIDTLVLLGGGTDTYPLTLSAAELQEKGTQLYVEVSRSSTSGQDPTSGMHMGAVFTSGSSYLATVLVWVP